MSARRGTVRERTGGAWRLTSGLALAASLSLAGDGSARADGESAVDAGSGRQQSLLEHRRRQLEGLRERIAALDAAATRAVARAAGLERELEASRERLEASDARAAALERERDEQRDRADAAADAIAALEASRETLSDEAESRAASLESRLGTAEADATRLAAERDRLLAERDEDRRANAASEARVIELERALAGARVDEPVLEAGAADAAPSAADLVLSERWYVPLENGAPRDYVGPGALGSASELPPASACEAFADGAAADGTALAKLEINGFPVTAFWVRREDGRPGICRLVPRTSGAFDARLSSLAVLRSERAIVVTRRGE